MAWKKSLDFYLIDFNVGIECQGRQHFCKDSIYNNGKSIEEIIAYDKIKYDLCKKHNIRIFYYSKYIINDYIDVMYTSKEELFKNIKN